MRIGGLVLGIILVLVGLLWTLQGSNVLAGSAMSGQSQWLYVGIVLVIAGAVVAVWSWRRR